jgi:hypothetical protein
VVEDKAQRVYNFHRNTVHGLAEFTAACGLDHPNDFEPDRIFERISPHQVRRLDQLYDFVEPCELLAGGATPVLQEAWDMSTSKSFNGN